MRHLWGTMGSVRPSPGAPKDCRARHTHTGAPAPPQPLLPRLRRGFADREDGAEGLVLRGRVGAG